MELLFDSPSKTKVDICFPIDFKSAKYLYIPSDKTSLYLFTDKFEALITIWLVGSNNNKYPDLKFN